MKLIKQVAIVGYISTYKKQSQILTIEDYN